VLYIQMPTPYYPKYLGSIYLYECLCKYYFKCYMYLDPPAYVCTDPDYQQPCVSWHCGSGPIGADHSASIGPAERYGV